MKNKKISHKVSIVMGSKSDYSTMKLCEKVLRILKINFETNIVSAHRTPERMFKYAKSAENRDISVIIAGAGGAAHLPGMIASHTIIPVIGVPILVYNDKQMKKSDNTKFSAFGGLDSLLSISEMPTGSPVVTVGINKSANAAIYALKILANDNSTIKRKLKKHKFDQHSSVLKESDELKKLGLAKFVKKKFK